jgi:hypothetical protein
MVSAPAICKSYGGSSGLSSHMVGALARVVMVGILVRMGTQSNKGGIVYIVYR